MAGYDPLDPTSADRPVPAYRAALRTDLTGVKIGVPTEFFFDLLDPEVESGVRAAVEVLAGLGATVVPVAIPDLEALFQSRVALSAEGLAFHDPYLRSSAELYGDELRHRLLASYFIPGRDLARANRARRILKERFAAAFAEVDLLATPGCATPSRPLTDTTLLLKDFRTGEMVEAPFLLSMVRMTALMNATGLPAVCVPAGFTTETMPISLQLIGRAFEDELVLGAAHAYEQATLWHRRKAPFVTAGAAALPA
jgi:aspartyl-tRNA(Asn)/glutamyl-tRNA(Gln) amidotransferase subunit A